MSSSELTLVPPRRLGAVLASRRHELGLGLDDLARQSGGDFRPSFLANVERGDRPLSDEQVQSLVSLYGIDDTPLSERNSELQLDLHQGQVAVGSTTVSLPTSTSEDVLERYVSLLYLLRHEKPGRVLSLRDKDLDTLGSTLHLPVGSIRSDVIKIMEGSSNSKTAGRLATRVLVGAAGALVAVTTIGSLVIVGSPGQQQGDVVDANPTPSLSQSRIDPGSGSRVRVDGLRLASTATGVTDTSLAAAGSQATLRSDGPAITAVNLAMINAHVGFDVGSLVPEWSIELQGERPGYKGMTYNSQRRIDVYVSGYESIAEIAGVLVHEVGHAIDIDRMDDSLRHEWLKLRSMPSVWWAGEGANDFSVGAGDFAEAVAAYLTGSPSNSEHGEFSPDQLAFVADVINR